MTCTLRQTLTSFLFFLIFGFSAYSQHSKVISAWKYLQDYSKERDTASLNYAKKSIEVAMTNDDTKMSAKTWYYAGKIYQALYTENFSQQYNIQNSITDINSRTLNAYLHTNISNLTLAFNSYSKSIEFDKHKDYSEDSKTQLIECCKHFENSALAFYNNKKYQDALNAFEMAININMTINNKIDSSDISNARIVAELIGDTATTLKLYTTMISNSIGNALTYHLFQNFLATNLKSDKKAFNIIEEGRKKYSTDILLINDEINFLLKSSDPNLIEKAISDLKFSLEKDPKNALLNLALGNLYDRLANPKTVDGKDLSRPANFDFLISQAENYYKISYSLSQNNPVTLFNLGALYNNKAQILIEKSNSLKIDSQVKKNQDETYNYIHLAKDYLEKAFALTPDDCSLMKALQHLYFISSETQKFNSLTDAARNKGCI